MIPEFIHKIDWALLRKQKRWLRRQLQRHLDCAEAEGLLALVVAIQDYAVDEMFIDEAEVFGE